MSKTIEYNDLINRYEQDYLNAAKKLANPNSFDKTGNLINELTDNELKALNTYVPIRPTVILNEKNQQFFSSKWCNFIQYVKNTTEIVKKFIINNYNQDNFKFKMQPISFGHFDFISKYGPMGIYIWEKLITSKTENVLDEVFLTGYFIIDGKYSDLFLFDISFFFLELYQQGVEAIYDEKNNSIYFKKLPSKKLTHKNDEL